MLGAFFRSCYYLIKMDFLRSIPARHEALKKRIHAFKIILPPNGIKVMRMVYISIPLIGGYFIMQWAEGQADKNLGKNGELLKKDPRLNGHSKTTAQQKEGLQRLLNSHNPNGIDVPPKE
jgi:hypothetical protein